MTTRSSYALSLFAAIALHAALAALLILLLGSGRPLAHSNAAPPERPIIVSVRFTTGSESMPRHITQQTPGAARPAATVRTRSTLPTTLPAQSTRPPTTSSTRSAPRELPPVRPALSSVTLPARAASPARSASPPQEAEQPGALPAGSDEAARPAPARAESIGAVAPRSTGGGTAAAPLRAAGPPSPGVRRSEAVGDEAAGPSPSFRPVRLLAPLRVSYPLAARRRGWEGLVLIQLSVEENGSVSAVKIEHSSGHRALDEAALQAALRGSFAAARRGATPFASTILLPVRFRLGSIAR